MRLPQRLDRRFEALVFDWDGTAVPDRGADASAVREAVEALCGQGVEIVVVSGTHVGNVDGQLAARPRGPGGLQLCLNRGSEVFEVSDAGPELRFRRVATAAEEAALTKAAETTVERLARLGHRAEIVADRLNRRKVDLLPEPAWADPPKERLTALVEEVEARLRSTGIDGLVEASRIAAEAAVEAGLEDPRVTSDAKHLEIGLTDKTDSARHAFAELRRRGVGSGLVLVAGDELGPLGGLPGSDSLLLVPEAARAVCTSVGPEPGGVPEGVIHLGGGPTTFLALLADQLERRRSLRVPPVDVEPGWGLAVEGVDPERERAAETLLTLGDGLLGTGGSPLAHHPAARPGVRLAGLYGGAGPQTDLLVGPAWTAFPWELGPDDRVRRLLDLRTGTLAHVVETPEGALHAVLFSALPRPGTVVLRAEGPPALLQPGAPLESPPQGEDLDKEVTGGRHVYRLSDAGASLAVAASERAVDAAPGLRGFERLAVFRPGGEGAAGAAVEGLVEAEELGGDALLAQHRRAWAERWEDADVTLEGDPELQQAVRFALFHLMGSVGEHGEAAVGARGLSGPGYRGHVFWDTEVYVLPFLAATRPGAARAILEYRLRRLPAARAAAAAEGREGARFPWESADAGFDVTPREARDLTGRVVPVLTGLEEEHIVADVAWAAQCYVDWSGDEEFAAGSGRLLLLETSRYWASRARFDGDGRAHIDGVIGPDEYHEHVDDNAFTNVMARWNLRRAAEAAQRDGAGVADGEVEAWLRLAEALVDGYDPATGLYEEFEGFFGLEPLVIAEVAPRRPVSADALLGRERVQASQVVKQADVLMLHHLLPEEVVPGSLRPNLEFYEPRTAHASSLSPAIHAAVLARAGRLEEAVEALRLAASIDLADLTGTTAAGLHLAAMGGVWQALAYGFAGVRPRGDALAVDPRLPVAWDALEVRILFRGCRVRIRVEPGDVTVVADRPTAILLPGAGRPARVGPEGLRVAMGEGGAG